jgi:hypothetical protein
MMARFHVCDVCDGRIGENEPVVVIDVRVYSTGGHGSNLVSDPLECCSRCLLSPDVAVSTGRELIANHLQATRVLRVRAASAAPSDTGSAEDRRKADAKIGELTELVAQSREQRRATLDEMCSKCGRDRPEGVADPTCSIGGYCNWTTESE